MKAINYIKNHMKYHTRQLEKVVEKFFDELSVNHMYYQVSLLAIDESENKISIGNYRTIDESLKEDVFLWVNASDRTHFIGEKYFFSNKFSYNDIEGGFIVALKYDDTEFDHFLKEYLKFMTEHLLIMIEANVTTINGSSDVIIYLRNQIYIWSREFVDAKISKNTIQLSSLSYLQTVTAIEEISKLSYENEMLVGKFMAISTDYTSKCDIVLATSSPIMLYEHKKVRKLLEITYQSDNDGLCLLYNKNNIVGFISSKGVPDNYYLIEFKGSGIWKFCQKNERDGQGIEFRGVIPKIICNNVRFEMKFKKCFKEVFECVDKLDTIWTLVKAAKSQKHGTMIVILDNIENEKKRLQSAGFEINANGDISKYIGQLAAIDGAILMDEQGTVHAIGTILDGETPAEFDFDMARGARYNSAIKYSYSRKGQKNLIVVFSEDGYENIISSGKELK